MIYQDLTNENSRQSKGAMIQLIDRKSNFATEADWHKSEDYNNYMTDNFVAKSQSLAIAREDLLKHKRLLGDFFKTAHHTLAEPVRIASVYTDMLKRLKPKWTKDEKQYLNVIENNNRRLLHILNKVKELSAVSFEDAKISKIYLNQVVQKVLEDSKKIVAQPNIKIRTGSLGNLHADQTHIEILFYNLIENAITYRKKDCKLNISIGRMIRKPDEDIFYVSDNGIGIDKRYAKDIFELHSRLSSNEGYPGIGMGLTICKYIVESYSGRIWVESELDKGSVFYFTLNSRRKN